MRVLVLSVLSAVLEDALAAHAHRTGGPAPLVCMPEAAARARAEGPPPAHPYELMSVGSLHDFTELRRLAASVEGRVDAIATTNECALPAAAFLRAHLGLPGMDLDTAVGFTDKHVMKERLAAAGVAVARHRLGRTADDIAEAAEALGWPVVVKHRNGFNSVNTHVVRGPADLFVLCESGVFDRGEAAPPALSGEVAHTGLATARGGFMIEEYLPVRHEYHCEILKINGQLVYTIAGRYSRPCLQENAAGVAGGMLLHPTGIEAIHVRRLARAAAAALRLPDGCAHAEVFETVDGRWVFGEIAARPGGLGIQPTIAHAYTGIDLASILGALARLETPDVRPSANRGTYGWAAALSTPARLTSLRDERDLLADERVVAAHRLQEPGTVGESGSLPIAYAFLRTDTATRMAETLDHAADLFEVEWAPTEYATVAG
jgi:biotin carboxylase